MTVISCSVDRLFRLFLIYAWVSCYDGLPFGLSECVQVQRVIGLFSVMSFPRSIPSNEASLVSGGSGAQ